MSFVQRFTVTDSAATSKGKKKVKESSQELVAANPARIELFVCNPSSKEVWLALGSEATKEEGIWLKKEGGSIIISGYSGIVSCVTSSGEGEIAYAEA